MSPSRRCARMRCENEGTVRVPANGMLWYCRGCAPRIVANRQAAIGRFLDKVKT